MDRLHLEVVDGCVDPVVNGHRLAELVADSVHGVGLLGVGSVCSPRHRIWIGEPPIDDDLVNDGCAAVLNCACGIVGCGGVFMTVRRSSGKVIWSDFKTATGDRLDLPRYQFAEHQVLEQLTAISK
ncbi:MAG: hypothetical protein AB7N61_27710 [Acidimicrobiia bacterium]